MINRLNHLAIIMDGNRRYAKKNGLFPWQGHSKGIETVKMSVEFCLKNKINYLSLYTFSIENFNRSAKELEYLFSLIIRAIGDNKETLIKQGVRVHFIGDHTKFPQSIMAAAKIIEDDTRECNKLNLNILFCYGGRQEIIAATKKIALALNKGELTEESLDQNTFKKYLWLPATPDPELIIRTGGAKRLSNFLLFQAAYAELYFTTTYWPELNENELLQAYEYYNQSQRNFGS